MSRQRRTTRCLFATLCLCLGVVVFPAASHQQIVNRISLLTTLIEQQPEAAALYLRRGADYVRLGELDAAELDFSRAESLGSEWAVVYERGRMYYQQEQFEASLIAFSDFLEYDPLHAEARVQRARAAVALGQFDAAMGDYTVYFEQSASPHPGDYLVAAQLLTAGNQVDQALTLLDSGMERLGLTPQLQRYAVELELQRLDYAAAIERWESLHQAMAQDPAWKIDLARLHFQAANTERALALLAEAETRLEELRPNPARQRMWVSIASLRRSISDRNSESYDMLTIPYSKHYAGRSLR